MASKVAVLLMMVALAEGKCRLEPNKSPEKGLYTQLPRHIRPTTACSFDKPQEREGMRLHVMMAHDAESVPHRGYFCSALRSANYYNVRVQVHNIRLGKKVGGYWRPACEAKATASQAYSSIQMCKAWAWHRMVMKIQDNSTYALIHDSDFTYGGGIKAIIRAYRDVGVDVLMGTEAACAFPIFHPKYMKFNGKSSLAACLEFWKYQQRDGDPAGSFLNSGFVMGRVDHLKTWLKLVRDMISLSTHDNMGDQSFFALAHGFQRVGKPWKIDNGPIRGFSSRIYNFTTGIDFRRMAFVVADAELGWGYKTRHSGSAFLIRRLKRQANYTPTVFFHWAGGGKRLMLCQAHRLPHEGACFPEDWTVCVDGQPSRLGQACPTQWTRGCQRQPDSDVN